MFFLCALFDFFDQVLDLAFGFPYFDFRIEQAGRTDDLFDYLFRFFQFLFGRSRADINHFIYFFIKFIKIERAVIARGREAEAEIDKIIFAGLVAGIHAADLRNSYVRFIDEYDIIVRKEVHEGGGGGAGRTVGQMAGIILDAIAVADPRIVPGVFVFFQPVRFGVFFFLNSATLSCNSFSIVLIAFSSSIRGHIMFRRQNRNPF